MMARDRQSDHLISEPEGWEGIDMPIASANRQAPSDLTDWVRFPSISVIDELWCRFRYEEPFTLPKALFAL